MLDIFYLAITFAFFAVAIAYVLGCDRLMGPSENE
jgi:hypothetical protein